MNDSIIRDLIFMMTESVGSEKTICPSEVARAISPERWRELMDAVRSVGCRMHEEKTILITQKGEAVKNFDFQGPIRFKKT